MYQVLSITEDKQFWIDASPDEKVSCKLKYVDKDGKTIIDTTQKVEYLDNNIWSGTIKAPNKSVIVIGTVSSSSKNMDTNFIVNYNLYGYFIYSSSFSETGLNLEWLQLNEKAEVFDYGSLIEIGDGFYLGKLNQTVPSLICVDDVCNIFKIPKENLDLQNCLDSNEDLTLKYILLEKQLKECQSSNNKKAPGKVIVNASDLATSLNIKQSSKTNIAHVQNPFAKTSSTVNSSTITSTQTSSISKTNLNTTLK